MAALAGAAWIRILRLGADGLWVDEAWTGLLVRVAPVDLFTALRNDDAPPLFYLLQRLSTSIAGGGEWGLRLLPALCGIAAVVTAWRLCRQEYPRAALPTAVALGFSSVAVHYAQQARGYSLLHLLAVWVLGSSLALRRRPSRRTAAWFLLACLCLVYSHNLGLLVVAAAVASGVIPLLAARARRRTGLCILGVLLAAMAPWFAAILSQLGTHQTANAWIAAWWTDRGGVLFGPLYTLAALANGAGAALHLQVPLPAFPASSAALRWISWTIGALGIGGALATLLQRRPGAGARSAVSREGARGGRDGVRAGADSRAEVRAPGQPPDRRAHEPRGLLIGAALFTVIPLLGLVAVSHFAGTAYVVGRTDTLALPGLAFLLGIGWAAGPRRWAPIASAIWVLLCIAALAPSWSGKGRTAKGSDRALGARLDAEIRPNDAVVFASLSRPTLEYYGRRLGWWERAGWKGTFPTSFDRNAAASWPAPLDSAAAWRTEALDLRHGWERDGTGAVWILAVRDPEAPDATAGAWPARPAPPPASRARRTAATLGYPGNVLVSILAGLKPVEVAWEYRQDWVSGDRVVLRLPRTTWAPEDSLPRLETRP